MLLYNTALIMPAASDCCHGADGYIFVKKLTQNGEKSVTLYIYLLFIILISLIISNNLMIYSAGVTGTDLCNFWGITMLLYNTAVIIPSASD